MAKRRRAKQMTPQERGRKGGLATRQRHGREHFVQAGKKGFMVTVARHWAGDRESYLRYLHECGYLKEIERLTARDTPPWEPLVIELPVMPHEWEEMEEDPVIAQILDSIRSAPTPEWGGL
jgi:general stress protein YciG